MNLITKTALPQFLNKNIGFRAICSSTFNVVNGISSSINNITTNWPPTCCRCQQNVSTVLHNRFLPQIDSFRSLSSNAMVASRLSRPSTILDKFKKMIGLHKDSKSNLRRAGHLLYEQVCDNIDYPKFMKHFHKENTFYSWFLVTEIHVWMLMVRAMADEENGRFVRNNIVEAMWKDVELRAKKLGQTNRKLVREQISDLADQFEYTLIAYDEGLSSDDKQLASAIWKQFFDANCDDYVQVELMVKYVRSNVAMLDRMSNDDFFHRRKIQWNDFLKL